MTRLAVASLALLLGGCSFTLLHLDKRAVVNPPAPTVDLPLLYCESYNRCHCYVCADNEADRRKLGAPSAECMQRYYVPCGKAAR